MCWIILCVDYYILIIAGSEGCALDKMANRLLDWFSVLMDEAGATAPPADG